MCGAFTACGFADGLTLLTDHYHYKFYARVRARECPYKGKYVSDVTDATVSGCAGPSGANSVAGNSDPDHALVRLAGVE